MKNLDEYDRLWKLARVAIADLEKCEADEERFYISMQTWHSADVTGKCCVCLAGSVMAQTAGATVQDRVICESVSPEGEIGYFASINSNRNAMEIRDAAKYLSLNSLRQGLVADAVAEFYMLAHHEDDSAFVEDIRERCKPFGHWSPDHGGIGCFHRSVPTYGRHKDNQFKTAVMEIAAELEKLDL